MIGFAGVVLLVGVRPRGEVSAGVVVVFSALCYAVAALYAARRVRDVSPLVTTFGALTAATLATLPVGLLNAPDGGTGWKVTASVLTLGIAGTGLAYVLYYGLLADAGASRSILITYLVPAFALAYGATLLGERVTVAAVGGLLLILIGVAFGAGNLRLRRRPKRTCEAELI